MIDDSTVHHLLDHVADEVLRGLRGGGKTLAEIDAGLRARFLRRKEDRIVVYEHMLQVFQTNENEVAVVTAHLRTLKRRKRSQQPTRPPATILPLRPEDRPDL